MLLKKLKLANFKNYADLEAVFSDKINCFVGNNGVGKTNLLDAIYYLSFCKSYFNPSDSQNVKYGEPFFAIHSTYLLPGGDEEQQVSCVFKRGSGKQMKINKKAYTRFADHIGKIPLVMISPYDQDLINAGSDMRRKFIDGIISQTDRTYLENLLSYQKAVDQRNTLLKQFFENRYFEEPQLQLWDDQLVRFGLPVFESRKAFLKEFETIFQRYFKL
ncbi:MAG: DNA replication/repair protein RecF, partial [Bacteroidales bacterium]|nr:DNA replication/repair protein RecF [Bacteroidales bacterium]